MKKLWPVVIGVQVALCSLNVQAQSDSEIRLNFQSMALGDALNKWAQAAGFRLIGKGDLTQKLSSPALQGSYAPLDALNRLLAGTSLTYEFLDAQTVVIREKVPAASAGAEGKPSLRLAAAQVNTPPARSADSTELESRRGTMEEVFVTAQKREERLQDVPVSIAVLGGEQLDNVRSAGLLETLSGTPGLTARDNAQGSTTALSVRGVAAALPLFRGASPIGFYLDSVPFGLVRSAAVPDANPFDLDRVEVLRGPQGTLYGASSLNGVVRVLTKDADLDDFEFKGRALTSSTDKGGTNYRADAAVNAPIIDGRLAARVVVGYEERSGWIDAPSRKDVNDSAIENVRLKLKGQVTDALTVGLTAWRSRTELGAPSIANDQLRKTYDDQEPNDTDFDAYSFTADFELSSLTVSSATSYMEFSSDSVLSLAPYDDPNPFDTDLSGKVFSQELLVNSAAEGDWRWSLGAFYRKAEESLFQLYAGNDNTDESESLAFFGQVTRVLLDDKLDVSVGLRHFEDEVSNEDHPGPVNTTPPYYHVSDKFDKVTPKATVTFHPNTDVSIYASYGEGFRSGFSQLGNVARIAPQFRPMGPDSLKNYEVGTKANLAEGLVALEAAALFMDWRGTQQIVGVIADDGITSFPAGVNAGKVDGWGFDVSLRVHPLDGLDLGVNYSWNDLAFRTPVLSGGEVLFAEGMRPTGSAEETVGGFVTYSAEARNGWGGRFETSANYNSAITEVSLVDGVPTTESGQPILLVRSSLSLVSPYQWVVTAFVDNLTNTNHYQSRNFAIDEWKSRVRPRTIGLEFSYHFGRSQ
jgi:iron complex outermembrane recepter protein